MKVLNVSQSFEVRGGSDVYFHLLTDLLRENGVLVEEFASSNNDDQFPKEIDFENSGISDVFGYIYNFEAKRKIDKYVKGKKFDIAHLHIYYGMLTSSILQPLKNNSIPIIQTLHEYKLYDGNNICFTCKNNNFYKSLTKNCNRNSFARTALSAVESYVSLSFGSQSLIDHYITVSDFQKKQIVDMGFDANKMTTVHNFVEVNNKFINNKIGDYVLYFGRLEKEKGIQVLLDCFKNLSSSVKLVIVGDGSYRDEVIMQIETSKTLQLNTKYLGFKQRNEVNIIIQNAKFIVVPSIWYETFGLTVIEAMSFSKPVIGSNLGGITEIIDDGIDGYLVEANNSNLLTEKIIRLWDDNSLVKTMGENALLKVKERFSKEAHLNKIKDVYEKVLNK